jgi:hypothetical protein
MIADLSNILMVASALKSLEFNLTMSGHNEAPPGWQNPS